MCASGWVVSGKWSGTRWIFCVDDFNMHIFSLNFFVQIPLLCRPTVLEDLGRLCLLRLVRTSDLPPDIFVWVVINRIRPFNFLTLFSRSSRSVRRSSIIFSVPKLQPLNFVTRFKQFSLFPWRAIVYVLSTL